MVHKEMVIPGASTDLVDKAGHLTVFCAWDHSLHLLITSVLLRPGIGHNMSYTVDDLALHQGLLYFREIDCSYIHVWRMPRRWALSPTTHHPPCECVRSGLCSSVFTMILNIKRKGPLYKVHLSGVVDTTVPWRIWQALQICWDSQVFLFSHSPAL